MKHFPGLGHADGDTDLGNVTDPSLAELEQNDVIPFEGAIRADDQAIMVSHAIVPGLTGGLPASVSPATYQLLRDTLDFQGVAITDALDAGAISSAGYLEPNAAVAAIEAGADMAMIDPASWQITAAALRQAVESRELSLASVDAHVDRIVSAKGYPICGQQTDGQLSSAQRPR
jgi:beta-N-acetylhexosaminidase